MDDKLIRFFNKINYKNIGAFKDSKVIKVTINTNDDTWNVYIDNKKPIEILSAIELMNVAKNGIDGDALRKIKDNTYVNTYFNITYSISQNGRITKSFKY